VAVEARLVKLGRDVGSIEVTLTRASSRELVATGGGADRAAPGTVAPAAAAAAVQLVTHFEGRGRFGLSRA
jgi:hypothetical protein